MSKMFLSSFQFNITHTRSPPQGGQKSPHSFSMSLVMFDVQLYLESKSNDFNVLEFAVSLRERGGVP
jgi:hypothetical protein